MTDKKKIEATPQDDPASVSDQIETTAAASEILHQLLVSSLAHAVQQALRVWAQDEQVRLGAVTQEELDYAVETVLGKPPTEEYLRDRLNNRPKVTPTPEA